MSIRNLTRLALVLLAVLGALAARNTAQAASFYSYLDLTSGGSAATVNYEHGLPTSYVFDLNDGAELTVWAYSTEPNGTVHMVDGTNGSYIGRWSQGFGIMNSSGDGNHTVDGLGWNDTLVLEFSGVSEATVRRLQFSYYTGYEYVMIDVDNVTAGTYQLEYSNSLSSFHWEYFGTSELVGTVFELTAFSDNKKDEGWKVSGVKVYYTTPPPSNPVPSPVAAGIGLMGFGLLGLKRNRRNRSTDADTAQG